MSAEPNLALKALVAILADESVRAAMTPEHFDLARAAGWKPSARSTFRVRLADKPRDMLVHLVEHGPATAEQLAEVVGGPVYSRGLNLLREMGLVTGPMAITEPTYSATIAGRRLVAEAKAAAEDEIRHDRRGGR